MKQDDRNWYIWSFVCHHLNHSINFLTGDYFKLYHWQQMKLGELAELFGIKPSRKGWSRAQTLFERLKRFEESQLPF